MISAFGVEDSRLSKAEKKPSQKSGTGDIVGGAIGATAGAGLAASHARRANEFRQDQRAYERNAQAFRNDADKAVGTKWEHLRSGAQAFAEDHARMANQARKLKLVHLGGVGLGAAGVAGGTALIVHGDRKNRARQKVNQS